MSMSTNCFIFPDPLPGLRPSTPLGDLNPWAIARQMKTRGASTTEASRRLDEGRMRDHKRLFTQAVVKYFRQVASSRHCMVEIGPQI